MSNGSGDSYLEQRNKMIEGASRGRKKNNVDGLEQGGLGSLFNNEE